jgi:cyclohexa-1,5-dienecarbonyl-CoA hydratase
VNAPAPGAAEGRACESGGVGWTIDGPLARVEIRRPPLNILDLDALAALDRAFAALAEAEPAPRVVLLSAAGERAFSAGVAVEDHTRDKIGRMLDSFHGAVRRLRALPAVSVAVVRGLCLGGGMELAASCDLVVAAEGASFGQPEIDLACFPPLGAALYPRALGPRRAADLVLTGRRLSAAEAEAWGLVSRRVPDGELDAAADELAATLLAKSGAALAIARRALAAGENEPFDEALAAAEHLYAEDLCATEDMEEGVAAFLEKRPPRWRHR